MQKNNIDLENNTFSENFNKIMRQQSFNKKHGSFNNYYYKINILINL